MVATKPPKPPRPPKTVWVVGTGEYSDYHEVCICPTEAVAEAIATGLNGGVKDSTDYGASSITEISYFSVVPEIAHEITLTYNVDPEDGDNERTDDEFGLPGHNFSECDVRIYAHASHRSGGYKPVVNVTVRGTDHERVHKVYSEQVAQAKADFDLLIYANTYAAKQLGWIK